MHDGIVVGQPGAREQTGLLCLYWLPSVRVPIRLPEPERMTGLDQDHCPEKIRTHVLFLTVCRCLCVCLRSSQRPDWPVLLVSPKRQQTP
jgi:hypothetical protein